MSNDLDMVCSACLGTGYVNEDPCRQCEGFGYHLTAHGKVLVDFLQRRGVHFPQSPLAEEEMIRIALDEN